MGINKSLIITDSSALVSLASATDSNHIEAVKASKQIFKEKGQLVLSGEVFSETINAIGKKVNHTMALGTASELLDPSKFLIVQTSMETRKKALNIFEKQPESVSFTDCLVMAFADQFETKQIFGFDEAFKKNGYRLLQP